MGLEKRKKAEKDRKEKERKEKEERDAQAKKEKEEKEATAKKEKEEREAAAKKEREEREEKQKQTVKKEIPSDDVKDNDKPKKKLVPTKAKPKESLTKVRKSEPKAESSDVVAKT